MIQAVFRKLYCITTSKRRNHTGTATTVVCVCALSSVAVSARCRTLISLTLNAPRELRKFIQQAHAVLETLPITHDDFAAAHKTPCDSSAYNHYYYRITKMLLRTHQNDMRARLTLRAHVGVRARGSHIFIN